MGCLLEFMTDILFEGIVEFFGYCYLQLMQMIVPDKAVSERTRRVVRFIAKTMAAVLFIAVLIGLCFFVQEDPAASDIGKYVLLISLSVMALQVLLGVMMRLIGRLGK